MNKEQYDEIKEFARKLTEKRLQVPDGQLLDQCQVHLDRLIEAYESEYEENETRYPEHKEEAAAPEPPHYVEPPRAEPEPEPPPSPPHSEPKREVRHTAIHKRPTPRKTHR